jgi:energy-converting hydrogenase B subunit D
MDTFTILQAVLFGLVALAGTAVVLTRNPKKQLFVAGVYGLLLAMLFYLVHSPDVSLSELAVGAVGLPFLVLFTLARLGWWP